MLNGPVSTCHCRYDSDCPARRYYPFRMTPLVPDDPTDATKSAIRSVLPAGARVAYTNSIEDGEFRFPGERLFVEHAVPKRQQEFRIGRECARSALAELGVEPAIIPMGPDRAPVWPPGVVGSITHSRGLVAAAVARKTLLAGLGFDAELAVPLEPDVLSHICTEDEQRWLAALRPGPAGTDWPKIIFSAKESVHKCVSPMSGIMLDFRDVSITIHPDVSRFEARLDHPFDEMPPFELITGRFAVTRDWVFTAASIETTPAAVRADT